MITEQEFKNHITYGTLTLDICKKWIDSGGDPIIQNYYDWTALIWAFYNDHLEVVKYLVKNGVDIDIKDNKVKTALHYIRKNIEGIKLFFTN